MILFLLGTFIFLSGCFIGSSSEDKQGGVIKEEDDLNRGSVESQEGAADETVVEGNNVTDTSLNEVEIDTTTEESTHDTSNETYSGNEDPESKNDNPGDGASINMGNKSNNEDLDQVTIVQENIAPEIELNIIIGPEYAQDNQVCYYRVRAGVKGNPYPEVSFSKDDSNGAWGMDTAQVNLTRDQTYILTCRAENIEGIAESSIELSWVKNSNASNAASENSQGSNEVQVDYTDIENFLIDVNLTIQQVTVLYKGIVIRNMICSGGAPETPTPPGEYNTYQKIYYQYVPKFAQGAFYWTRFYGPYLFHGTPTDINRNMLLEEAAKLGAPASHGCIRLSNDDAKWMYDILPLGIRVSIHN